MKRLLFLLFILLLTTQAEARGLMMVGGGAATPCNTANDYVGWKDSQTTVGTANSGVLVAWPTTAVCGGTTSCTLKTAYINHHGTGSESAIAGLYVYGNADPNNAANTLIATSGTISSSTNNETASSNMTTNPAVTNGTQYWLVLCTDATTFNYHYGAGATRYYRSVANCISSGLPANLGGGVFNSTADRKPMFWITVGP